MFLVFALAVSMPLPAPVAGGQKSKAEREFDAMTPEQVASKVAVYDDDLERVATLNTQAAFKIKVALFGDVPVDNFLRAFVDKKTGAVSYQLYESVMYNAPAWRFYSWANYPTSQGVQTVDLTVINRTVGSCGTYSGCTYVEDVAFDLSPGLVAALASLYHPAPEPIVWKYKLKASAGEDLIDAINTAEVAGLVSAVAKYKAAHGLP